MKKIDHLPKEEQIKKLKRDNKIYLIITCVHVPVIFSLMIYLFTMKDTIDLAVGFLISIPPSIFFGYVLPVNDNKEKIQELECESQN